MAPETQEQDKHANCSVLLCIGPLETGAFRRSGDGARLAEDMQAVMSDQPVEAAHEGIHRGQSQGCPPLPRHSILEVIRTGSSFAQAGNPREMSGTAKIKQEVQRNPSVMSRVVRICLTRRGFYAVLVQFHCRVVPN